MKWEGFDSLIEVTVRKSVEELQGIRYGRDVAKGELPIGTRILGSSSEWGLVYDILDLSYTKQVVKMMEEDPSNWEDFGVVVGREEELELYVVLLEGSSLKLSRLKLEEENHTIEEEEILTQGEVPDLEGFGLSVVRKENVVEVYAQTDSDYDYPYEKILEGSIPSRTFEGSYGLIGWSAEISTWFLKHLLVYGRNSSYSDYSLKWTEEEGWTGFIDYIPSRGEKLYYNSGNKLDAYFKPFRREGIGNDLYGDLSLAFSGFVEDIEEVGLPDSDRYKIKLKGNRFYAERDENITVLEAIDEQNRDVTLRDYYHVLEDLYRLCMDVKSFSTADSVDLPPFLNIDGSLKEAEETLLIEENKQSRITRAEEGIKFDVDIYERGEGENKIIRTEDLAEEEEEAIIEDINLEVKVGRGDFFNKFISKAKIEDERFVFMRENRYDKFFGDELDVDITREKSLPYAVSDLDLQARLTEDKIDMQNLRMKADITLEGHHHYLGGSSRQGTLKIGHKSKALEDREFYVEELNLDPDGTQIVASESPNMKFKERIEEVKEEVRIEDVSDVFDSLEEQRIEVKVDEPIGFDTMVRRKEEVSEARLLDPDGEPLTEYIDRLNSSYYRGYIWVDIKFKSSDLKLDEDGSLPSSDHRRARYVRLRTIDEAQVIRGYTLELDELYSHASWLLPDSYNIISSDSDDNTFTIGGDVKNHLDKLNNIHIEGAGESDGTYSISDMRLEDGDTVVETESNIDDGVEEGKIRLDDETSLFVNIAIQQPLGIRLLYISNKGLVLGHALGGLGHEGILGHNTELGQGEIVRDWSKNIYITDGIE